MQDGIIKGTGNSRYLKSISNFLTQYPTYQDFAAALVAGTLPIDLNGINETGWDQLGTALNKANLLSDETAAAMGLPNTAVPDDVLEKLSDSLLYVDGSFSSPDGSAVNLPNQLFVTGTYNGNQTSNNTSQTIELGFNPSCVIIAEGGTRFGSDQYCYGAIALRQRSAFFISQLACAITESGFTVYRRSFQAGSSAYYYIQLCVQGSTYHYIAFR